MRPWETVDRARAPDGTELVLARRGDEWAVRTGGHVLMSSRQHGSEESLAELALGGARRARAVLVGGLGLGFTLRAALDRAPGDARVVVAEVSDALVAWNRGPLAGLAGRPLEDARVRVEVRDVRAVLEASRARFDAVLLDVDNGPSALRTGNAPLYEDAGVAASAGALAPGGVLAVWSAGPDDRYLARLARAGLRAEARSVAPRPGGGGRHVIFLARNERPAAPRRGRARSA